MNKIKNILLILFNIIFSTIMVFLSKRALFNGCLTKKLNGGIVLIVTIVILLAILIFSYLLKNAEKKVLIFISLLNLIIFLGIQLFFAYNFRVNPSWDFGEIYKQGQALANGSNVLDPYFYIRYPNNIGPAFLLGILYKVFGIFGINVLNGSVIFNMILIDLSVIISYQFIKRVYNYKISTVMTLLILLITPFYTYIPIFYTDTLSIIIPILSFYLYYVFVQNNSITKIKYINLIFIGILMGIGIIIKNNIVISLIALIIYIIFLNNKIKNIFKQLIVILIALLVVYVPINSYTHSFIPISESEVGFPATHWIMMGLNGVGGYNSKDVQFTLNAGNKEQKKEANIKIIKERLMNYKENGFAPWINKKLDYTWANGTLFGNLLLERKPIKYNEYHKYIYGDKREPFLILSEASFSVMLILIFLGGIGLFFKKNIINYLFNITLFGLFLFLIIWETNSRYLVCMLPIFLLSASSGVNFISEILENKLNKSN